jgi:hypothetical protein
LTIGKEPETIFSTKDTKVFTKYFIPKTEGDTEVQLAKSYNFPGNYLTPERSRI